MFVFSFFRVECAPFHQNVMRKSFWITMQRYDISPSVEPKRPIVAFTKKEIPCVSKKNIREKTETGYSMQLRFHFFADRRPKTLSVFTTSIYQFFYPGFKSRTSIHYLFKANF